MTQPASRESLAALRERLDAVTGRFSTESGLMEFAAELYSVAELLHGQPRLRRRVADPATSTEARSELVGRLLEGKVGRQRADRRQGRGRAALVVALGPGQRPRAHRRRRAAGRGRAGRYAGRGRGRAVPLRAGARRRLATGHAAGRRRRARPDVATGWSTSCWPPRCRRSPLALVQHAVASGRRAGVEASHRRAARRRRRPPRPLGRPRGLRRRADRRSAGAAGRGPGRHVRPRDQRPHRGRPARPGWLDHPGRRRGHRRQRVVTNWPPLARRSQASHRLERR